MNTEVQKQVRIILGPIMALLRSRKFMTAVIGLFVIWLTAQVPSLAAYQAELILAISVIVSVIVGGIAHEDAAAAKAAAIETAAKTSQENLQAAIEAGIDAVLNARPPAEPTAPQTPEELAARLNLQPNSASTASTANTLPLVYVAGSPAPTDNAVDELGAVG